MTDFDADEPIKPLVPRKGSFWSDDRFLGWSGVVLALSAAFFPWYVFFNEEKFGTYQSASSVSAPGSDRKGRITFSTASTELAKRPQSAVAAKAEAEIITGSVPATEKADEQEATDAGPDQPFPPQPIAFRLMYVFKGRAMIEDKTGVYLVRKGDTLPDLSKVADFEERDGAWVIVTDNGSIYDTSGKRD
jgi:hypothetical protein